MLAPAGYYDNMNLSILSHAINEGLVNCQPLLGIPFSFCFTMFADTFDINSSAGELLECAVKRKTIWY